jgi:hypothetical protein
VFVTASQGGGDEEGIHMEINLGKGLVAVIDDEDADLVVGFKWYAMKAPQHTDRFYAAGWKHMPPGRYFVHLHRLIMNAQPGQLVDHIDRNTLNCRRSNLRFVTRQQNNCNRSPKGAAKTSKYKGVFFCRTHGVWRAAIARNRKRYNLGKFATEDDAARAYNVKARELFGDFAYLNDVSEGEE